jgi:Uma2 family endonuclease
MAEPTINDCCLVAEVADANLARARSDKFPVYALAGIPVYWIVNLVAGIATGHAPIEVYTDPDEANGTYRSRVELRVGYQVPVIIDGWEVGWIAVGDLLP